MRIIVAIALIMLAGSACAASDAGTIKDPRLAQPVSIECVNARLHTVLEQLSAKTAVTIHCGIDGRDWQVRDIPVTVCVKEMPLGELLKLIAASTHLLLSQREVGQSTTYRIWRDLKRRKQIDEFVTALEAAEEAERRATLEWEWDAASALNDHEPDGKADREMLVGKNLAGLLDTLGPDVKARVMAGEYIQYPPGNAPAALLPYLEPMSDRSFELMDPDEQALTPQDMRDAGILLSVRSNDGNPHVVVDVGVREAGGRTLDRCWSFSLRGPAGRASSLGLADTLNMPDKLDAPTWESPGGEWVELTDAEDWDHPILHTKVSLKEPKDNNPVTCGGVMAALSNAIGFTIIAEDFESHRKHLSAGSLFKKDTTIGQILADLDRKSDTKSQSGLVWHVNEKQKIIVGTADDWPFHHTNLAPEALLTYMKTRLDGDGVDLDDFLKVVALKPGQLQEWISSDPNLAILSANGMPIMRDLWLLYDSLPTAQKAQAHTESGLSMDGIETAYLQYVISSHNAVRLRSQISALSEVPVLTPYDREQAAGAVMKITTVTTPRFGPTNGKPKDEGSENVPMVTQYRMWLYVTQKGETNPLCDNRGVRGVPIYSPAREAELFPKPAR